VAAYEFGALLLQPELGPEQRLVASKLIQQLLGWIGTDAVWVPGAALLVTLVVWQFWRGGGWQFRFWVPLLMILESVALTLPLFVIGELLQQEAAPPAEAPVFGILRVHIVLALGAGLYEELVFRFYLAGGLLLLFYRVCRVPKRESVILAVVLAALAFAACHLHPIGSEPFSWPRMLMLTAAGAYLCLIFIARGLGVSTGCHAAYNLISLALLAGHAE